MTIKGCIKSGIERVTGTRLFRALPRGVDPFHDITQSLPRSSMRVIFDVGANVGQSAVKFRHWSPSADIYCFEPASSTYSELKTRLASDRRTHCFQMALGSTNGSGTLVLEGRSTMFHLARTTYDVPPDNYETVTLDTVDAFCRARGINRIGYLKIDAEGSDLEVLKGAETMLAWQSVDLVEVEAGMNCGNERHVPFEQFKSFLEARKYFLLGVYCQAHESTRPILRRSNLLFASERVIGENSSMQACTLVRRAG